MSLALFGQTDPLFKNQGLRVLLLLRAADKRNERNGELCLERKGSDGKDDPPDACYAACVLRYYGGKDDEKYTRWSTNLLQLTPGVSFVVITRALRKRQGGQKPS